VRLFTIHVGMLSCSVMSNFKFQLFSEYKILLRVLALLFQSRVLNIRLRKDQL
jgi:hypothetical protein